MTDPVAEYGRQIAWLDKETLRLDKLEGDMVRDGRPAEALKAERTLNLMMDRREALDAMVVETQATSLEGAMAQVVVANMLREHERGFEDDRAANASRMIEKLLYSIVGVLEAHVGANRSEFGGDSYMPESLNPLDWQKQAKTAA